MDANPEDRVLRTGQGGPWSTIKFPTQPLTHHHTFTSTHNKDVIEHKEMAAASWGWGVGRGRW